jgi:hypothetical protein
MRLLKIFMALFVMSIAVQSALATDLVRNTATSAAGQISYAVTYSGTPLSVNPGSTAGSITTDAAITVSVLGMSVQKADAVDAVLASMSSGGNFAYTGFISTSAASGLTGVNVPVGTTVAPMLNSKRSSVTGLNLYGYVTPDYAYAGQYATSITGDTVNIFSDAFTRGPTAAVFNTATAATNVVGAPTGALPNAIWNAVNTAPGAWKSLAGERAEASADVLAPISDYTGGSAATPPLGGAGAYTASKIYEFANAGGASGTNPWALANNAMGGSISTLGVTATDAITVDTRGTYKNAAANKQYNIIPSLIATPGISTTTLISPTATIKLNGDSIGYADKNIAYSNLDTKLSGDSATHSFTAGTTYFNSVAQVPPITMTTAVTSPLAGGNAPNVNAEKGFYEYSLVDTTNPNKFGVSDFTFF